MKEQMSSLVDPCACFTIWSFPRGQPLLAAMFPKTLPEGRQGHLGELGSVLWEGCAPGFGGRISRIMVPLGVRLSPQPSMISPPRRKGQTGVTRRGKGHTVLLREGEEPETPTRRPELRQSEDCLDDQCPSL